VEGEVVAYAVHEVYLMEVIYGDDAFGGKGEIDVFADGVGKQKGGLDDGDVICFDSADGDVNGGFVFF